MRVTGRSKAGSAFSGNIASASSRPSSEASLSQEPGSKSIYLTTPLHQNLGDQAVCFFSHQYIIDTNGGNPGFLDFVPELFEHSKPDDALAHSIRAISFKSLASKSSVKVLVAKGHEHYRTTLRRVTRMLESPEDTVQDSLALAIMLLVLFANHTSDKQAVMMHHARGLHNVLVRRG